MKRILFYAAAVGIFVSSALAKPARGAVPTVCVGGSAGCADAESFLSELLRNRLCGGGALFFGGGCTGGGGALQGGGSLEGQQDVEWFPGQGGSTQKPGTECIPGQGDAQEPGTEWFPGQGGSTQEPGTECIPGQGDAQEPGTEWFPAQGSTQAPETEWFPNHGGAQKPGIEWFPGQGEPLPGEPENQQPDTQLPPVQIPGIEWFPGGQGSGQGSQNKNPGQGSSSGSYITRIVELVNVQRTAAGLSPVKESAVLSSAADIRAQEIVSYFSHYRPDGTYFNSVLNQRGISYNGAGENIAYGYDTPERVMTEWMNSPSHRANILDSRFTKLGVGYYVVGGTKYWTQLFTY